MAEIVINQNSYVTEAELVTYATDRGIVIDGSASTLLIKAMDYIETRNFIGEKTVASQTLQFPRNLCNQFGYDRPNSYQGYTNYYDYFCEYSNTEVPQGIKNAQIIAALLIDAGNDLQPSVGRAVKREKVAEIEVEYMNSAASETQYKSLQDALKPFITAGIRGVRI